MDGLTARSRSHVNISGEQNVDGIVGRNGFSSPKSGRKKSSKVEWMILFVILFVVVGYFLGVSKMHDSHQKKDFGIVPPEVLKHANDVHEKDIMKRSEVQKKQDNAQKIPNGALKDIERKVLDNDMISVEKSEISNGINEKEPKVGSEVQRRHSRDKEKTNIALKDVTETTTTIIEEQHADVTDTEDGTEEDDEDEDEEEEDSEDEDEEEITDEEEFAQENSELEDEDEDTETEDEENDEEPKSASPEDEESSEVVKKKMIHDMLQGKHNNNEVDADRDFQKLLLEKKLRSHLKEYEAVHKGPSAQNKRKIKDPYAEAKEGQQKKEMLKKTTKGDDFKEGELYLDWVIPKSMPSSLDQYSRELNGSMSARLLQTTLIHEAKPDFTLIIQTSLERSYMLKHHCHRWEGPIVFVVYLADFDPLDLVISNIIPKECLSRAQVILYQGFSDESYPVNQLRNIGIQAVQTSHFFVNDVDFLPDTTLYRRLRIIGAKAYQNFMDPRLAIVVPAFSFARYCSSNEECSLKASTCPETLKDLHKCFENQDCHIFDHKNPAGHSTTGYHAWHHQKSNQLRKIPCFKSNRYEPYIVMKKTKSTPLYDERFHGYGKNKIQLVAHVRYLGWQFYVIPHSFIIHSPHKKSSSKKKWRVGGHREEMDLIYSRFLKALEPYAATHMRTHRCKKQS